MKERLVKLLACPKCYKDLALSVSEREHSEVKTGSLNCKKCKKEYPVINYVPRFVPHDDYVENFSFEWTVHAQTQLDHAKSKESLQTFKEKTGFDLKKLKNKKVLEAGCGMGRFLDVASKANASDVIGIDLSYSVESAMKNVGFRENVHVIQANIFHPPFKKNAFDYVYSIGVLHHTPNTKKAFQSLVPFIKKSGEIAIWLYPLERKEFEAINSFWRSISLRLPKRLLYYLCYLAVPVYYLKKIPVIGHALRGLIITSMHPNWRVRVLDTFDWYSPQFQWKHSYPEVFEWFKEEGLKDIEVLPVPVSLKGRK